MFPEYTRRSKSDAKSDPTTDNVEKIITHYLITRENKTNDNKNYVSREELKKLFPERDDLLEIHRINGDLIAVMNEKLGAGTSGAVYAGYNFHTGKQQAVKKFHPIEDIDKLTPEELQQEQEQRQTELQTEYEICGTVYEEYPRSVYLVQDSPDGKVLCMPYFKQGAEIEAFMPRSRPQEKHKTDQSPVGQEVGTYKGSLIMADPVTERQSVEVSPTDDGQKNKHNTDKSLAGREEGTYKGSVIMAHHAAEKQSVKDKFADYLKKSAPKNNDNPYKTRLEFILNNYKTNITSISRDLQKENLSAKIEPANVVDQDRLAENFDKKLADFLKIFSSLASTVDSVHNSGIILRDIKPENIIVQDGCKVAIIDAGSGIRVKDSTNYVYQAASGIGGTIAFFDDRNRTLNKHLTNVENINSLYKDLANLTTEINAENPGQNISNMVPDDLRSAYNAMTKPPALGYFPFSFSRHTDYWAMAQTMQEFFIEGFGLKLPAGQRNISEIKIEPEYDQAMQNRITQLNQCIKLINSLKTGQNQFDPSQDPEIGSYNLVQVQQDIAKMGASYESSNKHRLRQ